MDHLVLCSASANHVAPIIRLIKLLFCLIAAPSVIRDWNLPRAVWLMNRSEYYRYTIRYEE